MKVKRKIIKKLIRGLNRSKKDYIRNFDECIKEMERAETVEQVMRRKQELLRDLIELPLGCEACYFCLELRAENNRMICENCEYGKIHKICDHENSHWRKLRNKILDVELALDKYYENDTYPEKPRKRN